MDTTPPSDVSGQFNSKPTTPSNNTAMAVLSYLGPLVIIPFLLAKDDPFVKFHIKQGIVLVVIEILFSILTSIFWMLWMIYNLVNLGIVILIIIGILNAIKGEQKELPVVGQFAKNIPF